MEFMRKNRDVVTCVSVGRTIFYPGSEHVSAVTVQKVLARSK